ncbi:hypothetical protein V7S43_009119 [Phytophthora oleae]|uniref:Uncharacterized protein n=1 Tax=Phytophthora oleae TaxID=2107226 RepID=A0ABD3FHD0_9STRA
MSVLRLDLKVGTVHFSLKASFGRRHTDTLPLVPFNSTDASSEKRTFSQSSASMFFHLVA